eukprot:scaffold173804_cov32-Tisochrysis_lutea.AAC.1
MSAPPPKPWERSLAAASSSTSVPGAPKPWEQPQASPLDSSSYSSPARPNARPWESQTGTSPYSSTLDGAGGSMYGAGMYGTSNSLYNRPYGTVRTACAPHAQKKCTSD